MIKHILTVCAVAAASAAGTSLVQAQQGYPVPPGPVYAPQAQSYPPGGYPADYRRGPGAPDFDALEDDEAPQNSAALPPPGPVLSPGDPRYGRPAGPPPVIYADRPGGPPQAMDPNYDNRGLRPPEAVGAPTGATSTLQPSVGADGRPISLAALPPEEQPEVAPVQLPPNLHRQEVAFPTKEPAGTLIVDTPHTYLYYVLGGGRAIRYGVRVGRDGFTWTGVQKISRKAEWPDWHPPPEMIERQPYLPRFMAGGPGNPLGARAMYLGTTVYRIHGTNRPDTIGTAVSSGCFRLVNADVADLYDRVPIGTKVIIRQKPEL